jgi:asparagine synthase (glutamine-hydrolysing)
MCRITAIIDFNKNNYEVENTLHRMKDVMKAGGPDDEGSYIDKNGNSVVAFGHRRLSIIDLSCGHQPMLSTDENVVISFNGEIYNYEELKIELEKKGFIFKSHSDTEVIIQAYQAWGINCVNKFIGMFAFLLYDKKQQLVYAVRDRAGVKPLYYYYNNDLILLASELKSFHQHPYFTKELNIDALALYLQFSYIPAPHSIFKNVSKILPGHYLTINLNSKTIKDFTYWSAIDVYKQPLLTDIGTIEMLNETERLLSSACNYRMVADVPVGVFLSGGYDSSLVTALLQKDSIDKIKTFTIGFHEEEFNEAPYAKQVAEYLGTDHTEYYCTQQDALNIIPLLPQIYDEPFGDSSAIPTTLVSSIARQSVKVALSADGGDELFGGYNKYSSVINLKNRFLFLPGMLNRMAGKVLQHLNPDYLLAGQAKNDFIRRTSKLSRIMQSGSMAQMTYWYSIPYTNYQLKNLTSSSFNVNETNFKYFSQMSFANDDKNSMLAMDYVTYLPDDILTKVDRATMSAGLEGREPLLDQRLVEWLAQLPGKTKIKNGVKKFVLKEIVHKYVPKSIMHRPKMGFGVPIIHWFKNELKEYFETYLSESPLNKHKFFNTDLVQRKKSSYFKGNVQLAPELWNLLMFQMWYDEWMNNTKV